MTFEINNNVTDDGIRTVMFPRNQDTIRKYKCKNRPKSSREIKLKTALRFCPFC